MRKYVNTITLHEQNHVFDLDAADEAAQCQAVKQHLDNLARISNPSEQVQITAVKTHQKALRVLLDRGITPSRWVMTWAIRRNLVVTVMLLVNHGIKIPDAVQVDIVSMNPKMLEFLPDPAPAAVETAILEQPELIQFVTDPSEHVQELAVSCDGDSIQYIIDKGIEPSDRVKMTAIKNYGRAIRWIKNPSFEQKKMAVMRSWYALEDIPNAGPELELLAVGRNWRAIKYINNPSEKVQLRAIRYDTELPVIWMLSNGIKLYDSVARYAVKHNNNLLLHILEEKLTPPTNIITATVELPIGVELINHALNDRTLHISREVNILLHMILRLHESDSLEPGQ